MLFQPELGWSVLDLPGRFADSGSAWACPLSLRCLSQFFPMDEKINYLRNKVLCVSLCTYHRWGGLVFIVDVFSNQMVIRILSYWMEDFLSLSLSD